MNIILAALMITCVCPEIKEAWFHIEGPEVVIEPDRDHGEGPRMCTATEDDLVCGPTFFDDDPV